MSTNLPDVISRYFERDADRDIFPGGTADLNWDFTIAGQHITRLTIAP